MSTEYLFPAVKLDTKRAISNPYQKLILIALADLADANGRSYPGIQYLSDFAGCSKRSIVRNLGDLQEGRYLTIVKRQTKDGQQISNAYVLHPENWLLLPTKWGDSLSPPRDRESPAGVTESPKGGDCESPNTTNTLPVNTLRGKSTRHSSIRDDLEDRSWCQ